MKSKLRNRLTKLIYLIKHLHKFSEEKEFHDCIREENQKILETTWTDHPLHRDIDPKEVIQAIRSVKNKSCSRT